jgi:hypothetical protein
MPQRSNVRVTVPDCAIRGTRSLHLKPEGPSPPAAAADPAADRGTGPAPARRLGRRALVATGSAVALMALTAVLGPSAAVIPLPPGAFPFGASVHPSAWLVSALLGVAVIASVTATWWAWQALEAGWAPSPRRLLAAAGVAIALLAIVPPVAGADVLSYAAYGHIAARGLDAYRTAPDSLRGDPIAAAVEDPWRATPSVYGPLALAEQEALVRLAGNRLRPAVGLLDLVNALAFAVAGLLLYALAGPDDDRRRRAVLAFALNPILLFVVVAGGHVDALVAVLVVAGLGLFRRSGFWAGFAGGAAVLVKLTAGLPLAGWAWAAHWSRSARAGWGRTLLLVLGAGGVVVVGYGIAGLHALDQARRASQFVSVGTPWRPVRSALQAVLGTHAGSVAVSVGSLALGLWLAVTLGRALPHAETAPHLGRALPHAAHLGRALPDPAPALGRAPSPPERLGDAVRAGLVLALAWTLAAPYVLAWYDALPWVFVALLPHSRYHRILLAHTGMLALAYLPGRVVALPPALNGITTVLRSGVSPAVLGALIVLAIWPGLHRNPTGAGPIMGGT